MSTLIGFGFTLFVTSSLIRLLSLNAHHVGLVDIACSRKTHKTDIPMVGGIAIFFGFMLALFFVHGYDIHLYFYGFAVLWFSITMSQGEQAVMILLFFGFLAGYYCIVSKCWVEREFIGKERSAAGRGRIVGTQSIRFRVTASVAVMSVVLIPDRRMQAVASSMGFSH